MKNLFIFLSFSILPIIYAQTPEFVWQEYFGEGSSSGYSVYETDDNGYLVLGTYSQEIGNNDLWLLKLNANREVEWDRFYGGSQNEFATKMIKTQDNNFILFGYTSSNDGDITENKGSYDVWIVKINPSGEIIWQKTYGGSDFEQEGDIIEVNGDGYIITSMTSSQDGDVGDNYGGVDFWVVKLSDEGEIEWENNFGGTNYDYPTAIIATNENEYLVSGVTYSSDGDITNSHGAKDYWVLKINETGNLIWEKTFGGSEDDEAMGIIRDHGEEDNYIVYGYSYSSDGDVSNSYGENDGWLVKIDTNGQFIWEKSIGTSGIDAILDLKLSENLGYVYAGLSQADGSPRSTVAEINANGEDVWRLTFGTVGWMGIEYISNEINYSENGSILVAGSNTSDYYSNIWIAKVGTEEMNITEVDKTKIYVFPNPAKDFLYINSLAQIENVEMYNFSGQKISGQKFPDLKEIRIDVRNLIPGNYTVIVKTKKNTESFHHIVK